MAMPVIFIAALDPRARICQSPVVSPHAVAMRLDLDMKVEFLPGWWGVH